MKLQLAADLLNQAQKPYILAGHGVLIAQATNELRILAEKAGIPVANTLLGLSSFPQDSDLFAGMLGMHGRYAANMLTNEADVILAVGMRFDDRVTGRLKDYAPNAKIIHIDIDPSQLNRLVRAELAINADARTALTVLMERINNNNHGGWIEMFRRLDGEEYRQVTKEALSGKSPHPRMAEVVDLISRKTSDDAIIVADVGQHQMIAAQYYRPSQPDSFITSGGAGTMGYALPAGLGAKIAAPDREIVVISGDGSFQMNIQELVTIRQEGLPVKMVILNNGHLGMVRQWQQLFFEERYSYVKISSPDFVTIAKANQIKGERVRTRRKLNEALNRMLAEKDSYLLDVIVEGEENTYPMIPSGAAVNEVRLKS